MAIKIYLEVSYKSGGFTHFPVMSVDDSLDIDERNPERIATVSIRDNELMDILEAIGEYE